MDVVSKQFCWTPVIEHNRRIRAVGPHQQGACLMFCGDGREGIGGGGGQGAGGGGGLQGNRAQHIIYLAPRPAFTLSVPNRGNRGNFENKDGIYGTRNPESLIRYSSTTSPIIHLLHSSPMPSVG